MTRDRGIASIVVMLVAPTRPAILFDLGDVLVRLNFERGLGHFARLGAKVPPRTELSRVFFSPHALACNRGEISVQQFLERLAIQLDVPETVGSDALAAAWCDIFDRWPQMEALAGEVLDLGHAGYLLSNTDPLHFSLQTRVMPVLGRLTGLHLSYEVKLLKPDPAFFVRALERFGLTAADCAYLDDRPEHVAAARSVGIPAFVHTGDVAAARRFLRERGVEVREAAPG